MVFIWKPPFSQLFFRQHVVITTADVYLNITSGMVAKYVAATRGTFVQKNFPFAWKNKDIFRPATGRKPRWSRNMCYSNQNSLQTISYWLKKREWTGVMIFPGLTCIWRQQYSNTHNKECGSDASTEETGIKPEKYLGWYFNWQE